MTRSLKNDIRNLVNFHASSRKSENLHFDRLLLSKAYKDLFENVQKSYVSWHWTVIQSLRENWFLVPKMTWWIWWILMQAMASLKICTLIWYFCQYYIKFLLKKHRRILSWQWRVIQTLKKNRLWGIWWILTQAVESLKTCTLMGNIFRKDIIFELKKNRGVVSWEMTYHLKNDIRNLVNSHTSSWK